MRGAAIVLLIAASTGACSGGAMPDNVVDANGSADDSPRTDDAPSAADLLAAIARCDTRLGGPYATDENGAETVTVCGLTGAAFWKADLDVDCDGKMSAQCSIHTDLAYQNETAATDSHGDPLDAATLPYVVAPSPSNRWDFEAAGLALGSVVAVIYAGRVVYGVIGDTGPTGIIGEASYAMAAALGIDPDPATGGAGSGVAYIAFTGGAAHVDPIEDHAAATTIGVAHAKALLGR